MRPGDKQTFRCDECSREFAITLEPRTPHAEDAIPEMCPFCSGDIEES